MFTPPPTWADVAWLREQWDGPFCVKGITRIDDAKRAVDAGATAIQVSNHGGNNLDSTPAPIRVLPGIVEAVGRDVEVILDGGIRRGSDVVKALALGARAVAIGRAYLWGLAAAGQPGVENVFEILRSGIGSGLMGLGRSSVHDLVPEDLIIPPNFTRQAAARAPDRRKAPPGIREGPNLVLTRSSGGLVTGAGPAGGSGGIRTHGGQNPHALSRRAPLAARTRYRRQGYVTLRPRDHARARRSRPAAPRTRSSRTPPTTSGRWLRRRSRTTSHSDPTAPVRGSQAPNTIRSTRASTAAPAHIVHGSRVTASVQPPSRQPDHRGAGRPPAGRGPRRARWGRRWPRGR